VILEEELKAALGCPPSADRIVRGLNPVLAGFEQWSCKAFLEEHYLIVLLLCTHLSLLKC